MNQNQELIEAVKACLPDLEHYAVNHKDGPDERLARLKAVLSDQLPDLKLNPNCDAAKAEPVVRTLLRRLLDAGYTLLEVFDGEDHVPAPTFQSAIETIFSVDSATIILQSPNDRVPRKVAVMLYLCNGVECIGDYTDTPELGAIVDQIAKEFGL